MSAVFCLDALSSGSCVNLERTAFLELSSLGIVRAVLPLALLAFAYTRWRGHTGVLLLASLGVVLMEALAAIPRLSGTFSDASATRSLTIAAGLAGAASILFLTIYQVKYGLEHRWQRPAAVLLLPIALAAASLQVAALTIPRFQGPAMRIFFTDQAARNLFTAETKAALALNIAVQGALLLLVALSSRHSLNRPASFFLGWASVLFIIQFGLSLATLNLGIVVALKFLQLMGVVCLALHAFLVHRPLDASGSGWKGFERSNFLIRPVSLLTRSSWSGLNTSRPNSGMSSLNRSGSDAAYAQRRTQYLESHGEDDLESLRTPASGFFPLQPRLDSHRLSKVANGSVVAQARGPALSYVSTVGAASQSPIKSGWLSSMTRSTTRPLSLVAEVHTPKDVLSPAASSHAPSSPRTVTPAVISPTTDDNRLTMRTDTSYPDSVMDAMAGNVAGLAPPQFHKSRFSSNTSESGTDPSPKTMRTFGFGRSRAGSKEDADSIRSAGSAEAVSPAMIQEVRRATRTESIVRMSLRHLRSRSEPEAAVADMGSNA